MQRETVPTSRGERNKGVARRFHARGWVPVQFAASGFRRVARRFPARGSVLAEQTCIARGSPVQTKLACVEVPFPPGVLQDDGAIRARHEVLLFADENIRGLVYSIEGPARAPASSKDEELAHGLADEPTWRLPASGWDFANSRQLGKQT